MRLQYFEGKSKKYCKKLQTMRFIAYFWKDICVFCFITCKKLQQTEAIGTAASLNY